MCGVVEHLVLRGEDKAKWPSLLETWAALEHSALEKDITIKEAVKQISQIHSKMEPQFDCDAIEVWCNKLHEVAHVPMEEPILAGFWG